MIEIKINNLTKKSFKNGLTLERNKIKRVSRWKIRKKNFPWTYFFFLSKPHLIVLREKNRRKLRPGFSIVFQALAHNWTKSIRPWKKNHLVLLKPGVNFYQLCCKAAFAETITDPFYVINIWQKLCLSLVLGAKAVV